MIIIVKGVRMEKKAITQGLILVIGQVSGKIISLIFIFLLASKLKPIGLHLYTYAYIPYSLFLDLAGFGLIPGASKAVSTLLAENKEEEASYLLKKSTILFIALGIIYVLILNLFNDFILKVTIYTGYTNDEYLIIMKNLQIGSLSLFIYPLISFYKGFLQGNLKMLPSAISLILEYTIKIILFVLISNDITAQTIPKIFLIFVLSQIITLIILLSFMIKYYLKKSKKINVIPLLYKSIIPFGTATFFFTIYQIIDTITLSKINPHLYTAYMFETTRLIFIPIIICQSIAGAITPKINMLYKNNKIEETNKIAYKITKISIYFLIPIIYIFIVYSKDIYSIIYSDGNYYVLKDIAILIFFIGFYKIIIGISQGMPKFNFIIFSTLIGAIAKLVLNVILIPSIGYQGAIISTSLAITVTMLFAYIVLYKGEIKIFICNMRSIVISVISLFSSMYFSSILIATLILGFSKIATLFISSLFIMGFYFIFIAFIELVISQKQSKQHILK